MRSVAVIATLCGVILLAFLPVWYRTMTGQDQVIVEKVEGSVSASGM
jgi:hypothetical protein